VSDFVFARNSDKDVLMEDIVKGILGRGANAQTITHQTGMNIYSMKD
jgi:hypothetical protein